MHLEEITGNDLVKKRLMAAFNKGQLFSSLLFSGPDGIGKGLFAKAIAKKLWGKKHEKKIDLALHPDLHIYYPEGKSRLYEIKKIRGLIEEVHKPPFESPSKMFILHDAEKMLPSSANALLKTLEEPCLDTVIILLTSSPKELLPTILSRLREFTFTEIREEEITSFLEKHKNMSRSKAYPIAKLSHGSLAKALEIADDDRILKGREHLLQILLKKSCAFGYFDEIFDKSREDYSSYHSDIDLLFSEIALWFRDLHLLQSGGDINLLYFKEAAHVDMSKLPSLEEVFLAIDKAKDSLTYNMKLSTCLEHLFLQLS